MKQFLLPRELAPGESLELGGEDYHYLHTVRRLADGDRLACLAASGRRCDCSVALLPGARLRLTAIAEAARPGEAAVPVAILPGIPKAKKLDAMIRQSVELGAAAIRPLECRNSVPELGEKWEKRQARYEAIIREAVQQSGAKQVPVLHKPCSVKDLVENHPLGPGELGLFLHEKELEQSSLHGYLEESPVAIRLIVGPEGGLAPEEVSLLAAGAYHPVYFGDQVMRCETAVVAGLAAVRLLLLERPKWSRGGGDNS